jgi:hypothetical protein
MALPGYRTLRISSEIPGSYIRGADEAPAHGNVVIKRVFRIHFHGRDMDNSRGRYGEGIDARKSKRGKEADTSGTEHGQKVGTRLLRGPFTELLYIPTILTFFVYSRA